MELLNISEAKARLSSIIERIINQGEEFLIIKAGKPVAKIVCFKSARKNSRVGLFAGKISIAPDFDKPLKKQKQIRKAKSAGEFDEYFEDHDIADQLDTGTKRTKRVNVERYRDALLILKLLSQGVVEAEKGEVVSQKALFNRVEKGLKAKTRHRKK